MRRLTLTAVFCLVSAGLLAAGETPPTETGQESFKPPEGLGEGWYARIETSKGPITAQLFPEQAPQTVAHFVALASGRLEWTDPVSGQKTKEPYYDGVRVHRAEAGILFAAGDQRLDGRRPPYLLVPPELTGPHTFRTGYMLGMSRFSSDRFSAVEFFITVASRPDMVGQLPCFGKVVDGRGVVFNITAVKTYNNGRPIDPINIDRVTIFKVGDPIPLEQPKPFRPTRNSIELVD